MHGGRVRCGGDEVGFERHQRGGDVVFDVEDGVEEVEVRVYLGLAVDGGVFLIAHATAIISQMDATSVCSWGFVRGSAMCLRKARVWGAQRKRLEVSRQFYP
jgi:hypothetical protein